MALRIPSPKALTKPEAYLAYKAGIMSRDELKQSVYNPLNNYEGWLAKWCGLLETYPTNEDGTPQCLTDEEGLLAYLCGVTNRYPATNSRPDDARISAYIRYLVSARYVRPDHPLNREEFYLSLIKTQFIPSGDPSSDIVIDGTTKAPFVDVKLYGDTFQQTYEGKNLFNNKVTPYSDTLDSAGITYEIAEDGTITTAGISTAAYKNIRILLTLPAGSYKFSGCPSGGSQNGYSICVEAGSPFVQYFDFGEGDSFTLTEESQIRVYPVRLGGSTGIDMNGKVFRPMITVSTAEQTYEPFVGGQPSPSPAYPQQIQTVTGRQVVNVKGKNLNSFPYASGSSRTHRGVTFIANPDGSVTIKGTHDGSGTAIYYFRDFWSYDETGGVVLDANTTVTASITGGAEYDIRFIAEGYHSDGTYDQFNTTGSQTITTTAKATFNGRITVYAGFSSEEGVTVYPMIEAGSTATAYEPYSSNDYEINLGKNLWSATTLVTGYYKFADGELVTGGNPNYVTSTEKIDVTAGESYHISADKGVGVAGSGCVFFNNDTFVSSLVNPSGSNFTVPEGANKMVFNFFNSAGLSPSEVTHIQLELGSTASSYAPYFKPIKLSSKGDKEDYIYPDGDEWKLHKDFGEANTLDADIVDRTQTATSGKSRYIFGMPAGTPAPKVVSASDVQNVFSGYCSGLRPATRGNTYSNVNNVIGPTDGNFYKFAVFYAEEISAYSLGQALEWLKEKAFDIVYELETPTDTVITNQALIDQLNALKQGGAEEGTTYIKVSATDPNLPAKLYVEAPKYD